MSALRGDRYASRSDADSIESLSKKLAVDLRKHIRAIGNFPVLSDGWCAMADSMERVGNITEMEQQMPKEHKDATLWEGEELALRYILEDGKLNVCLRSMVDFKQFQREAELAGTEHPPDVLEKLTKFERGLGSLLKNAWRHVEALQTTDLPLLLEHITAVFSHATANVELFKGHNLSARQESVALHYLYSIAQRLEDLNESRIMAQVMERKLLPLVATHLNTFCDQLSVGDLEVAAQALGMLCDSEEFRTHQEDFVSTNDERASVVQLEVLFEEFMSDLGMRRTMRPLLDFISACKRRVRK